MRGRELLEQVEKAGAGEVPAATPGPHGLRARRCSAELIDTLLDFPGHIIATMRSKTEWTTQQNDRGRSTPVRVGLAPEQGKGIEYEFDLLLEISTEHIGRVIKDRTGKFQDTLIENPGEDFGKELAAWLAEGTEPPQAARPPVTQAKATGTPVQMPAATEELPADQRAALLALWTKQAAERGVAETKAIELLNAVLTKRSTTPATADAKTLTEAIDALTQGKFDKALGLQAALAPQTAPATQSAPTQTPAAEDPMLAELATIENWEQFQEIAAGIAQAHGVNDVAFANGLDLATGKINRKGKEASISRITLRSWAAAMHLGTFDWNTGTIIAKK